MKKVKNVSSTSCLLHFFNPKTKKIIQFILKINYFYKSINDLNDQNMKKFFNMNQIVNLKKKLTEKREKIYRIVYRNLEFKEVKFFSKF